MEMLPCAQAASPAARSGCRRPARSATGFPTQREGGFGEAVAPRLAYLIFWIGCVHYTPSLSPSINDNTYYSTCENTKAVLTKALQGQAQR